MAIPIYLAMTAAEFRHCSALPQHTAWLSCLFSPYSTGISNLPKQLPAGSLLILSDRTPVCGHDPEQIKKQMTEAVTRLRCSGVLLDLQRPGCEETTAIVRALTTLPCTVAVSEMYAQKLNCPVFLPPTPPDIPLKEYLAPWKGREIWLEIAMNAQIITLTAEGASSIQMPTHAPAANSLPDETLHCHYTIQTTQNAAEFMLYRTREDIATMLAEAQTLGVKQAVGLWQEFR